MVKYKTILKIIEKELTKSYSHKPHLADLPYDRRSNNPDELQERIDEIDRRLKDVEKDMDDNQKELKSQKKELKTAKYERQENNKKLQICEKEFDEFIEYDYKRWKEFQHAFSNGFHKPNWWNKNFSDYVSSKVKELDERIESMKDLTYANMTPQQKKDLEKLSRDQTNFMSDAYDHDDETEGVWESYGSIFFRNVWLMNNTIPELQDENKELTYKINRLEKSTDKLEDTLNHQKKIRQDYIDEKKRTKDKMKDIKEIEKR